MSNRKLTPEENTTFCKFCTLLGACDGVKKIEKTYSDFYGLRVSVTPKKEKMDDVKTYLAEVGIPPQTSSDGRFLSFHFVEISVYEEQWEKLIPEIIIR